jgi:histone acetyltransferase
MCFRPFPERGFVEMVFLAVDKSVSRRGVGAQIMNHVKEYLKETFRTQFIVGYADNFAVKFFEKQGFAKRKVEGEPIVHGYICTDYNASTLMQCRLLYNINYLFLKETLKIQKTLVLQAIAKIQREEEYPPLEWEDGRQYSELSVPGVVEALYADVIARLSLLIWRMIE